MCVSKNKSQPAEKTDMRGSGKKRYVFLMLVRQKKSLRKLPDYRGEEYFGRLEFD